MSVWSDVDAFVARHKEQTKELRSLAREGGVFRRPRFRAPCVWVLITGSNSKQPGTKSVFTSFETAKALEPDALRIRALRLARAEAKAAAAAEKKAAQKARSKR